MHLLRPQFIKVQQLARAQECERQVQIRACLRSPVGAAGACNRLFGGPGGASRFVTLLKFDLSNPNATQVLGRRGKRRYLPRRSQDLSHSFSQCARARPVDDAAPRQTRHGAPVQERADQFMGFSGAHPADIQFVADPLDWACLTDADLRE